MTSKPALSIRDAVVVVSITISGVLAYANLKQAVDRANDRVAALELRTNDQIAALELADMPSRMDRLEYLFCVTDDASRAEACKQLGILK